MRWANGILLGSLRSIAGPGWTYSGRVLTDFSHARRELSGYEIANMIISGRYSCGVSSAPHAAERLKELQRLLDSGLVTREEYEQKRAEILKQL